MNFFCTVCDREFCSPSRRRSHHSRHHSGISFTPLTEAEYRSRFPLDKSRKYCATCDYLFLTDFTRDRHVRTAHQKNDAVDHLEAKRMIRDDVEESCTLKKRRKDPREVTLDAITLPPPPPPPSSFSQGEQHEQRRDILIGEMNENPLLYVRVFENGDPSRVKFDIYIPPSYST